MPLKDLLQQVIQGSSYQRPDVLTDKAKRLARRAYVSPTPSRLQTNVRNLAPVQQQAILRPQAPKLKVNQFNRALNTGPGRLGLGVLKGMDELNPVRGALPGLAAASDASVNDQSLQNSLLFQGGKLGTQLAGNALMYGKAFQAATKLPVVGAKITAGLKGLNAAGGAKALAGKAIGAYAVGDPLIGALRGGSTALGQRQNVLAGAGKGVIEELTFPAQAAINIPTALKVMGSKDATPMEKVQAGLGAGLSVLALLPIMPGLSDTKMAKVIPDRYKKHMDILRLADQKLKAAVPEKYYNRMSESAHKNPVEFIRNLNDTASIKGAIDDLIGKGKVTAKDAIGLYQLMDQDISKIEGITAPSGRFENNIKELRAKATTLASSPANLTTPKEYNRHLKNAYKVATNQKGVAQVAHLKGLVGGDTPESVMLRHEAFREILAKHRDMPNDEFNTALRFIKTLNFPENIKHLSHENRINLLRRYDDYLNTVGIKPVVEDGATYVNTSFVTHGDVKKGKLLSGSRPVLPSPQGVDSRKFSTSTEAGSIIPQNAAKTDYNELLGKKIKLQNELKKVPDTYDNTNRIMRLKSDLAEVEIGMSNIRDRAAQNSRAKKTFGVKAQLNVPPELEPLAKEAAKYDSAEEFVNSKINAFHQTNAKFDKFQDAETTYFRTDKLKTSTYGKETVEAFVNTKKPYDKGDFYLNESEMKELLPRLKSQGYDAIILRGRPDDANAIREIISLDSKNILTKSQLTDLYNQVKGTTQTTPKVSEEMLVPALGTQKTDFQNTLAPSTKSTPTTKTVEDQIKVKTTTRQPYAETSPTSIAPTKEVGKLAVADFKEWQSQVFAQEGAMTQKQFQNKGLKDIQGMIRANTKPGYLKDATQLKDISNAGKGLTDVYRNFEHVFGKDSQAKRELLDPFDSSKAKMVDEVNAWGKELENKIIKGLGIEMKSKESAAVQQFGEKLRDYQSLVDEFGEVRAKNIVSADQWFRSKYDQLLTEVNAVRARIYPNNPDMQIPRRRDYYRHFRDLSDTFSGLKSLFESSAGIDPSLAGISEYVKPRSKWLSFAQKRLGVVTEEDAVGGFIDYINAQSYAKNIDPHISKFRALREELVNATSDRTQPGYGKLNNFIEFLDDFANDLAGKTNPADRALQKYVGRKPFTVVNWINSRTKLNVILGNLSSAVAQFFNIPQGLAEAGLTNSARGGVRALSSILENDPTMSRSQFLKTRFADNLASRFDPTVMGKAKNMAGWITRVGDEVGTKFIWNSLYEKALKEGAENPIKYADDLTRKMVAGRGIGEVPLLQKSKAFQLMAPFQIEVSNVWHVMREWAGEKAANKFVTFFVASYVMNRMAKDLRGSDVSFDPINAMVEAANALEEEENTGRGAFMATGRLLGEILSNAPLGQSIASVYPEYGAQIGDTKLPTREDFFGEGDPTRFGSGPLFVRGVTDPLAVVPPFGGQQLKRTYQGIQSWARGYDESASGKIRMPIEQSPINLIKSATFGKYSTKDARDYFNNDRSVLGEKQSETYKRIYKTQGPEAAKRYYDSIISKREGGGASGAFEGASGNAFSGGVIATGLQGTPKTKKGRAGRRPSLKSTPRLVITRPKAAPKFRVARKPVSKVSGVSTKGLPKFRIVRA